MNVAFRGAKVQTRPNIACRMVLPTGLVQGAGYFGVQGGMIVVMIGGAPYRLRIGLTEFSSEEISLPWRNSGVLKQVWMQQTVESLVIQDGQSNAIIYNGSTARRAGVGEVPRGRMMAYLNGRLWVAINANELVAGDIRTRDAGSELNFTETNYLSGGGSLWFSRGMTALAGIPVTGTSDYGALLVFGRDYTESVRADITDRDAWSTYPGFVTNVLRSVGAVGDWSVTEVNQDLFWRDALGQLRSLRSSLQSESGPGNSSLSREVSRIVDFDSEQLLGWSSGIYFQNRHLFTASPFLNLQGGVSFRDLVSLDFAPISTMQGRSSPAYDGNWSGVNWTQLLSGEFNGKQRAFGISSDDDGLNRLWEFSTGSVDDMTLSCGSSVITPPVPIECAVEYPRVDFADPKKRKQLTRCDVWLSEIDGEINLKAYWRSDNDQQWTLWDEVDECATLTDPAVTTPHVWKNLLPQQRPLIKTFSIPDALDDVIKYQKAVGFTFQVRLVWTGSLKIQRAVVRCNPSVDDPDYVDRAGQEDVCVENDVTGNEILYQIPLLPGCADIEITDGTGIGSAINYGDTFTFDGLYIGAQEERTFTITNPGGGILSLGTVAITGNSQFTVVSQPAQSILFPGQSTSFTARLTATIPGNYTGIVVTIPNNSTDQSPFIFYMAAVVTGPVIDLGYESAAGDIGFTGYLDPRYYAYQDRMAYGYVGHDSAHIAYNAGTTYPVANRVFSAGKFYRSIQAGNLNHTPASSPTWWTECEVIKFWLTQTLSGDNWECFYSGSDTCNGAGLVYTQRGSTGGGTTDMTLSGGGTVNPATGVETWTGNSAQYNASSISFGGVCPDRGTFNSNQTNQSTFWSSSMGGLSSVTESLIQLGDLGCASQRFNHSTIARNFSSQETALNHISINGALTAAAAGTWSNGYTVTGMAYVRTTADMTGLLNGHNYQMTVVYSADVGAAPASDIFLFTASGSTHQTIFQIPFGVAGSHVSIASVSIVAV